MKNIFPSVFRCLVLLMLSATINLNATHTRHSRHSVRLAEHIPHKALTHAIFLENLSSETQVPITFILPLRNEKELDELIHRIHNPSDKEHYGKYLTTEEFNKRFAPRKKEYRRIIAYAQKLGLTVTGEHANRLLINATGPASAIEKGFSLRLQQYQLPNGRKFHAPSDNPQVPTAIASIITGIVGLDNHSKWHSYHHRKATTEALSAAEPEATTFPSGPSNGFAPNDLKIAYDLAGVSADGSGQVIALFELASYQASDINAYAQYFDLPTANLKNVLVDGGSNSGIDAEVTLDIELALALAPRSQIYVYEGPNSNQGVLDTYNRIATDNVAKQVSTSWGLGEDNVNAQYLNGESAIFKQMAVQGQTIYAAAGDSGAFDDYSNGESEALVVDDPASQPYVVGVGGTSLKVNATSCAYGDETVWNDGLGNGAGGGGVSMVWPIPSWQANVSTATSQTYRNVPDVCLNADPNTGYAIYYDGQWQIYGGTSCAAPLWAAFTALVNQELAVANKPLLGFANPTLYSLASGSSYPTDFHDVTSGNNLHYNAGTGYDNASGWGSFNGANLFVSLTGAAPSAPPAPAPTPEPTPPTQSTPALEISLEHASAFEKGKIDSYQIVVSNAGHAPTTGPVSVTVALPAGITYSSASGAGWKHHGNSLTFTHKNALEPGATYPTLVLRVLVSAEAPDTFTTTATVAGGGSAASTASNETTAS